MQVDFGGTQANFGHIGLSRAGLNANRDTSTPNIRYTPSQTGGWTWHLIRPELDQSLGGGRDHVWTDLGLTWPGFNQVFDKLDQL